MAESLPLVSVIVACYNHDQYIEACLTSILRQTYPAIELIVLDDGSKDRSPELIAALAKEQGFFFEAQANMGLSATLNKGLNIAKGEYIVTFGSDDIMMLDRIEKQVAYMQANTELGLCGGNMLKINEHGTVLSKQKFSGEHRLDFEDVLLGRKEGTPAPTLFFRQAALAKAGGFHPEIKLEDLYIELKISSLGYPIGFMNDVLAYYRVHPTNTYKNYRYMIDNVLKTYEEFRDHPAYEQAYYRFLNSMLVKCAGKDKALARELLKQIPLREFRMKTLKGIGRLLFS
ncbi:glycosyltransferase [Aestuariirhabdus litorea]|uniref:Glycosyltransferase n=1 Tax=Aestuariirhabdus litorea TaxID=2528527 RepID=A0A3P3VI05_9GAMM|nr:glycosyltransferase [Aestuariirhabdus litorea]RRJ82351.1 glycosyltransferase [Aestuariirhabdus litorea]RWW92516.1 glycosyltransferase [Endozoicomonadaceae bacterium GTF-13]